MTKINEITSLEFSELDSIYFNTAYFGPSPLRSKKAVQKTLEHELNPSFARYNDWYLRPEKSRELFSNLINSSPDNIFHACSVSDVNNLIMHSLPSDEQHHVTVIDKDYPSNVLPFMLANQRYDHVNFTKLELKEATIPTADWLDEHLPKDTTIFCISWVTFDTGKRIDIINISKVLKRRGIRLILDVTQGLGGLEISMAELACVDAMSCASYKWLLGPYGHAFGYISDDFLKILNHPNANWITSKNSKVVNNLLEYTTETLSGARRFDRGQTANLLTISALEGSLGILSEIGLKNIQSHNRDLSSYFIENFSSNKYETITPMESRGNIICLKGKNINSLELEQNLKDKDIDVSIREGNIRISFHLFNQLKQVDYLLNALCSI